MLHALQNYVGDEFEPREKEYLVRLFFVDGPGPVVHFGAIQFFTNYCRRFEEVGALIFKADKNDRAALEQAGYTPMKNTGDYYYYSTSNENR